MASATSTNPRVGVVGFTFRFNVTGSDGLPFDFAGYAVTLVMKKPDKSVATRTATGGNGTATYTTVANDLDVPGNWLFQLEASGGGRLLKSGEAKVKVESNLR